MWRNYLKVGWRNLLRDRLYTGINVLGLVTGLVSFLLIALYIRDERSYDQYHCGFRFLGTGHHIVSR